MKLIVDIDKELKGAVYRCGLFLNPTEKTSLINAINNGIPLDKIKAEIRKHCERYMDGDIIADEVIQAVDRIGKAERSDKE